jgi:hypothetical protein
MRRCPASLVLSFGLAAALSGCASSPGAFGPASTVSVATALQGTVRGSSAPVAGAHVYLMKANNTGYGQPSVSLLDAGVTGLQDSIGAYVETDSHGNYSVPAAYACSGQDQVYLYVVGGNAGPGANSGVGLMAAIGDCPQQQFSGTLTYAVNEITTVGTAYAIAGFASDATHVSYSGSALGLTGLQNAFANVANLYVPSTGGVLTKTPAGNGQVPSQTIGTLANVIAACIHTSSPASPSCETLFSNATSPSGATPADTANAMLNIAHNPGANVAALYSLTAPSSPFSPSLAAMPNDFTLGINFTGAGLNNPYAIAIDAEGNAWVANVGNSTVSKLNALGAPLSPAAGNTNGTPIGPVGVAIDLSGDAWIVNAVTSSLTKYASSGALLSPSTGYNGGGLAVPQAIASDALGNTWVANYQNSVSKFSNGGTPISPAGGYSGGGIGGPVALAIDASGAVWLANTVGSPSSVSKLTSAGQALSPGTGFFGGGLSTPFGIAIDSAGNAWVANYTGNSVTKLSSAGVPLSPATGFTGGGLSLPYAIAIDGGGNAWVANSGAYSVSEISNSGRALSPATGFTGGLLNGPQAIAADGSGNIWVANGDDISVTELLGASVPVVTPLVTGIKNNVLGTRP